MLIIGESEHWVHGNFLYYLISFYVKPKMFLQLKSLFIFKNASFTKRQTLNWAERNSVYWVRLSLTRFKILFYFLCYALLYLFLLLLPLHMSPFSPICSPLPNPHPPFLLATFLLRSFVRWGPWRLSEKNYIRKNHKPILWPISLFPMTLSQRERRKSAQRFLCKSGYGKMIC